jgi:TolB-like protein/DNA-binding SARP family transcriptional activator/Tfp pilus assembly protein PilF
MLDVGAPSRLRLRLLGTPLFSCSDSGSIRVSAQKGLALLAYLAMHQGAPVSRAILADLLWSDRVDAQARQNLRQLILTLRRDLSPRHLALLQTDDQSISLAAEMADVDAVQFEVWASDRDPAVRTRCLELPWGPFLDGFSVGAEAFDEWVAAERHRLDAIATRVFADLAKQFDAAGDGERAILALERLIAIDPAEEERHRRLLALEGRYRGPDAALARAKELAARLKREVDVEPEPATRALVEEIRRAAVEQAKSDVLHAKAGEAVVQRPALDNRSPEAIVAATGHRTWHPSWPQVALGAALACGILAVGATALLLVRAPLSGPGESAVKPQVTAQGSLADPSVADPSLVDSWQSPNKSRRTPGRLVPIAVLPFTTSGPDANAIQPTAETVTDDLTNVLSRVPGLRVISRQTMRAYQQRAIDVATIGTELGVRYVLEGSMHKIGDRLRVNAELIDPSSRSPVWSDRIERDIGQQREILDEIVGRLGRQLQVSVTLTEAERAAADPSVAALVQKGWAAHYSAGTRGFEAQEQARSYFSQALAQDPDDASAKTGLAAVLVSVAIQDTTTDYQDYLDRAEALLGEAMAVSPRSTGVHYYTGLAHRARGRLKEAVVSFERAIDINPSHAASYAQMGLALSRLGEPAKGLDYIRYAMRLSPKDPVLSYWLNFAGFAELELEHDEGAIESFRQAQALRPRYHSSYVGLAAAYALSGRLDDARRTLAELRSFAPQMSRERLLARFGDRGTTKHRLTRGLELALAPATAPSWQSPRLPSQRTDDIVAPGRGLVAIIVLPFRSQSENGDGTGLVADMMTEDLTYLLSRVPVFRVISHQTAIAYRGQTVDAVAIGAELGVHYVIEGSISTSGNRLRTTVALVDARNRLQIWSGRFERVGEDRHTVQAEIINGIARELHVSVEKIESGRSSKDPDVQELIFKGFAAIQGGRTNGVEGLRPAESFFLQAIERDPGAIRAQIGLGAYHAHMAVQLYAPDPAPHLAKAEAILQQMIDRHPNLSEAYPPMGLVHVARGQMQKAMEWFERAIELNPSHAPSHAQIGRALTSLGHPQAGLEHVRYAMQLSPRDPVLSYWHAFAGFACLELGRYDEAIDYLGRAHAANPTQPRTGLTYVAALALAGRMSEALLKLRQLQKAHPHLTQDRILKMYSNVEGRTQTTKGIRRVIESENSEPSNTSDISQHR